jgi:hypothetical protein
VRQSPSLTASLPFILAAAVATSLPVEGPLAQASALTEAERGAIDGGRQVVREQNVRSSAWPRVTVYRFIDASPEEAAAVFVDYAAHASYFPGISKSVISRRVSPRVTEVDYVLEVPVFADEDYTVRDSVSTYDGGASYRVDWVKVRARSTKEIVGSARFEPYRNTHTNASGTLVTYDNLVAPGQMLAGPYKGRALKQVRETVTALGRRVEAQRRDAPGALSAQVEALIAALSVEPSVPPP